MKQCVDCGPVAIFHAAERWSLKIDSFVNAFGKPFDFIWQEGLRPVIAFMRPGRLAPIFFSVLSSLRLGSIVSQADEKNNSRARSIWNEARRRGIVMKEFRPFGFSREFFFATAADGRDTRAFEGLPRPRGARDTALHWMDDKGIMLRKFEDAGIPVPRGAGVRTEKEAVDIFRKVAVNRVGSKSAGAAAAVMPAAAVIVKPAVGSRSRHTYMNITDEAALIRAFRKAKEISPRVVIEEEIPGFVFRITLIGGKIGGVMRREPPHVVGDGRRSVRELVEDENKDPLRSGPTFHKIELGHDALGVLQAQGMASDSIPENGKMVVLHPKMSRVFGASTTEIDDVHPDNAAMFMKIAEVVDDPLIGIDFIMEDASRPWRSQKCGIIECNSLPYIDIHEHPYRGKARNAAGLVWDIAFGGVRAGAQGDGVHMKDSRAGA